jgi:hypothetical protein
VVTAVEQTLPAAVPESPPVKIREPAPVVEKPLDTETAAIDRKQAAGQQETERQQRLQQEQQQKLLQEQQSIAQIKEGVLAWASAWSAGNVDTYLAAYAGDFSPSGGQSLGEWRDSRRERLQNSGTIKVSISDLVVDLLAGDRAQATFTQAYQSDTYADRVKKTLSLRLANNRWLITQELTR